MRRMARAVVLLTLFSVTGAGAGVAATMTPEVQKSLTAIYIVMFNAAPSKESMDTMASNYESGMTQKMVAAELGKSNDFKTQFPGFLLNSEVADKISARLFGDAADENLKTWGNNFILQRLNAGLSVTEVIVTATAAMLGATNPDMLKSKTVLENKITVAEYYTIEKAGNPANLAAAQSIIASVTDDPSTVTTAKATIDAEKAKDTVQDTVTTTTNDVVQDAVNKALEQVQDQATGAATTPPAPAYVIPNM